MARRETITFDGVVVVQIVLSIFLFTLGLIGIMDWNSNLGEFGRGMNRLFGRAGNPFNIIVALIELAAGAIMFLAVFIGELNRVLYWGTWIVVVIWIIEIIIDFFAQGAFEPNFLVWLNRLAADVIVLGVLWLINRKYA
jgi:hypothetical protein